MKKRKNALWLALIGLLIGGVSYQATAQTKKENRVKVKVVGSDGKKVVDMDTTFTHDVFVIQSGGETTVINMDSIMDANREEIDKHMKVMAFTMDSLNDFHFEFDGDMEKMHIEIEKMLKEKGIELENMEEMHRNHIMFLREKEGDFDINEFISEDGDVVKIIQKEIDCEVDGESGVKTIVIATDDEKMPMHWKEKHTHHMTVKVESIPMEDIPFLKKVGISSKKLTSEPLDLKDVKVKIEKIMENEKLQTLMHIECELPDGDYLLELFNQEGDKVKEKADIKAGPLKEELDLKKEEAPYYLILSKNNQLFGRKIIL
ncbi:hypothetical protein KDU71_04730 [Carboxylicivirga sediminis]|uniref:DUF4412 domain-containing protein n=1 Tax=Carboxylicivirga sediminis TaxID=2006564 RepID=A0A941IUU7_9BACT|nr:hypothetical protein [Carboxylicivirga sediminis]MBR8534856.1 hypothetical protein [Carboxylicivirga sediminis]